MPFRAGLPGVSAAAAAAAAAAAKEEPAAPGSLLTPEVEARLGLLEDQIAKLKAQTAAPKAAVQEVRGDMKGLSQEVKGIARDMERIMGAVSAIQRTLAAVKLGDKNPGTTSPSGERSSGDNNTHPNHSPEIAPSSKSALSSVSAAPRPGG